MNCINTSGYFEVLKNDGNTMSSWNQVNFKRLLLCSVIAFVVLSFSLKNLILDMLLLSPGFANFDWLKLKSKQAYYETKKDIFFSAQRCPCEGENELPGISDNYTHKVVVVKSPPFWYNKYGHGRIVTCTKTNYRVMVSYAQGNVCGICSADFVVINAALEMREWIQLQKLRTDRQIWVHTTEESPFNSRSHIPDRRLADIMHINVTQTWHPNASIYMPYGEYVNHSSTENSDKLNDTLDTKKKLMLWVSSHCYTQMWNRIGFAYDLAKFIHIDMYGYCGNLTCLTNSATCLDRFREYKFILALENSCCGGYITEKFWNALLKIHAIPVVVGGTKNDYFRFAPPHSFIHADDFSSMKNLADYIVQVSENKTLYYSYFKWRETGHVVSHKSSEMLSISDEGVCSLLEFSHSVRFIKGGVQPFHPYGPDWLGGCFPCGKNSWIKKYVPESVSQKLRSYQ